MKNIDDTIRDRLKEALLITGMTQVKLAEAAGISAAHFNRVIKGTRQGLSPDTLYKISKVLNVPVSYFFGETDWPHTTTSLVISPETKYSYGELLRNLLKARGLRQTDLARLTDIDNRVLNNYCRDIREPNRDTQKLIADALHVPIGYFFNEISLEEALKTEIPSEKINKLHNIAKYLDEKGIEELIRAAEKEKTIHELLELKSKKIS
jgi:transcriptional regulator with XRE-family HTH domain